MNDVDNYADLYNGVTGSTEGDITSGTRANAQTAQQSAVALSQAGSYGVATLTEFAAHVETFDTKVADLNQRLRSNATSAQRLAGQAPRRTTTTHPSTPRSGQRSRISGAGVQQRPSHPRRQRRRHRQPLRTRPHPHRRRTSSGAAERGRHQSLAAQPREIEDVRRMQNQWHDFTSSSECSQIVEHTHQSTFHKYFVDPSL
ncbi:hypothetical protein [Aeromicrobium halocynthiae]